MLIVESLIILGGLLFILFLFIRNTYKTNITFAKSEAKEHYGIVKMIAKTFVQVFGLGKKESEIIDD